MKAKQKLIDRERFAEKWGYGTATGYGNALFDYKEKLLEDLDEYSNSKLDEAIKEIKKYKIDLPEGANQQYYEETIKGVIEILKSLKQ